MKTLDVHCKRKSFLKNVIIIFGFIISTVSGYSQVAVNMDGALPDSSAMLDVQATGLGFLVPRMTFAQRPVSPAKGLLIYQTDNNPGYYYFDSISWQKLGRANDDFWQQNGSNIYYNSGKIGVGTNDPSAPLHVSGGIELFRLESTSDPMMTFYHGSSMKAWIQAFGDDLYITNKSSGRLRLRNGNVDRLVIDPTGNVVIGSSSGASGYRLSVNGKIACEEILIDDFNYWPDYVFEKNYGLPSIEEMEKSINENKHLPGIPSAKEIKDNGGYEVGDIQKKLLEKVEELSLYIIDLNKRVKTLEEENRELKSEKYPVK